MQLESLANELLLELFEFLDDVHLIRAFYGLNSRFDSLIFSQHKRLDFDFRHVAKDDFDLICQHYLPSTVDQVNSLHLSNDEETPNLLEHFLSYGFSFDRFQSLKSLSIYSICLDTLIIITYPCQYFPNLTHLSIIKLYTDKTRRDFVTLINNIWSLPKLTHLKFADSHSSDGLLFDLSVVSLSIENIFLGDIYLNLHGLYYLLTNTPNLRRLYAKAEASDDYSQLKTMSTSIISLEISFIGYCPSIIHVLKNMSQLRYLTLLLRGGSVAWNGYQWQEVIGRYFPQLKVLRFRMDNYNLREYTNIDELINSFRTPFWLERHQWFIECRWFPILRYSQVEQAILYTLPYAFDLLHDVMGGSCKSTCSDKNYYVYDRLEYLNDYNYSNHDGWIATYSLFSLFRFPNIRHLTYSNPNDVESLSYYLSLDHLISLEITVPKVSDYHCLQTLLDRTPRLYSLTLRNNVVSKELFQLNNPSIRRLDLQSCSSAVGFSSEDCVNLISSPLGHQCEVLLICVDNPVHVLSLIQQISNLRFLSFRCIRNGWDQRETNNELGEWLKDVLPSTCSINSKYFRMAEIWIGRRTKENSSRKSFSTSSNVIQTILLKILSLFK
jgi:hypothetical protein